VKLFLTAALISIVLPASATELKPPFRTDHKAPLKATAKIEEQADRFTKFRVEFNGIEGDRVPGHLFLPKKISGRVPAALVQHGIGDKKHAEYIVECCRMLAERSIIALAIDAPGRGERKGPSKRGPAMWNLIAVNQWYRQHCGDYSRALDYLTTRPDVDAKRVGYVGFSWGAITGVTFTAHDPRVRALTSVVGGGLIGLLGKKLDPITNAHRIAPRPLLFINASKDQIVLKPLATALHKAAGPHAIVKWYDTDHTFSTMDRAIIMKVLADFMKANLQEKVAAKNGADAEK
jgi:dienelactone hydrolase|tara:strand:- start:403 stop:1275 length:873 start_codon:yes stop_codon:yes gene_type:complete